MIEKTISEVGEFTFGKHKGKRFTDVLREDYGYLLYLDGKGFSFTNNARVMMHITQYVHKKTKNYTSGNFMYHMLVATYFAVDYAKRKGPSKSSSKIPANDSNTTFPNALLNMSSKAKAGNWFLVWLSWL